LRRQAPLEEKGRDEGRIFALDELQQVLGEALLVKDSPIGRRTLVVIGRSHELDFMALERGK
jgi:hypothetical protein